MFNLTDLNNKNIYKIIDLLNISIYWKDTEYRILGCNKYVLNMFGMKDRKEIIGKNNYDLFSTDEADRVTENDKHVFQNGAYDGEEYSTRDSGEKQCYQTTKTSIVDRYGNVIGLIGVSLDITAQKESTQLKLEKAEHEARAKEQAEFREIVGKAVHDMKSTLASMENAIKISKCLSEGERVDLNNMRENVEAIADQLRNRYKNPNAEDEVRQPVLVYSALQDVLNERKLQHKDVNVVFKADFNDNAKFAFIKMEPSKFKRAITNLINNAVDAVKNKSNKDGVVEIGLYMAGKKTVAIDIVDNGKGIPEQTLEKLNNGIKVTEGKENGEGHGVLQAREAILKNEGDIDIVSYLNSSTMVFLKFPKISTPGWIAEEIKFINGDTIIVVDDDPGIHTLWETKLKPILKKVPNITVEHFSEGKLALNFIKNLTKPEKDNVYLLSDYQLLNQDLSGIDIIREAKIKRSVLVTSQQLTAELKKQLNSLKAKMLPKNLVSAVDIIVDKKLVPNSKIVDFVWLDDNRSYIEREIAKYYSHLNVDIYDNPFEFLDDVIQYPTNTKILFDNQYYHDNGEGNPYGITGTEVAQQLHEKGYNKLFMVSGESVEEAEDYFEVILKKDKEKLKDIVNS